MSGHLHAALQTVKDTIGFSRVVFNFDLDQTSKRFPDTTDSTICEKTGDTTGFSRVELQL